MGKNVIYTIFCGRKKYLKIQMTYVDKLLEMDLISEVHLWAFTTNQDDLNYLHELTNKNNKCKIFYPHDPHLHIWYYYYNYYLHNVRDDDIVIKADDDIVFIDTNKFEEFVNSVNSDSLYFPNIINNDVCAYFQTKQNIHNLFDYHVEDIIKLKGYTKPLTNWFLDYNKAYTIHELFLENQEKFKINSDEIVEYNNRISINFYAIKGSSLKKIYKNITIENSIFDEDYFGNVPLVYESHKIKLNFNVVHFQFGPQNSNEMLDCIFLKKYEELETKFK